MKNPPAFPRPFSTDAIPEGAASFGDRFREINEQSGMTLRDYFAASAMQGMISNPYTGEQVHKLKLSKAAQAQVVAENSYEMADAMLEAREK